MQFFYFVLNLYRSWILRGALHAADGPAGQSFKHALPGRMALITAKINDVTIHPASSVCGRGCWTFKPVYNLAVMEFDKLQLDAYEFTRQALAEDARHKLPKLNNKKHNGSPVCHQCHQHHPASIVCRAPTPSAFCFELVCANCKRSSIPLDDQSGFSVCTLCGACRPYYLGTVDACAQDSRPSSSPSVYKNYTHIKERISQWLCQEPTIPARHRQQLVTAYNRMRIETPAHFQIRELDKGFIRLVIRQAGLSSKKHLEKWVTIHSLVRHSPIPPRPSYQTVSGVEGLMQIIVRQWVRAHPANNRRKKNILSINLLFLLCLLKLGQKQYDTYRNEFPLNVSQVRIGHTLQAFSQLMGNSEFGVYRVPIRVSRVKASLFLQHPRGRMRVGLLGLSKATLQRPQ